MEWGGEGHSIKVISSPPPSPPLVEEREKTFSSRMVVVLSCALVSRLSRLSVFIRVHPWLNATA